MDDKLILAEMNGNLKKIARSLGVISTIMFIGFLATMCWVALFLFARFI